LDDVELSEESSPFRRSPIATTLIGFGAVDELSEESSPFSASCLRRSARPTIGDSSGVVAGLGTTPETYFAAGVDSELLFFEESLSEDDDPPFLGCSAGLTDGMEMGREVA
jgi:hypothetical protein